MVCQAGVWLPLMICCWNDEPYSSFRMLADHLQSRFNVRVVGDDDYMLDAVLHRVNDRVHRQIYIALLFFQLPDGCFDAITRPLLWVFRIDDFCTCFCE